MRKSLPRYNGETSRSAYERSFEHLNNLASLSSKQSMIKPMLTDHEGKDMAEIKWGFYRTRMKKSAFERQLEETVCIERKSKENIIILNSMSQWQNSALPRLVTRKGNAENERELKEEKEKKKSLKRK